MGIVTSPLKINQLVLYVYKPSVSRSDVQRITAAFTAMCKKKME